MTRDKAGVIAWLVKLALAAAYGIPLIWIVITSLKRSADVFKSDAMFTFVPSLGAYRAVFNQALFVALKQSVFIALGTTALVLLIGIPAAYGLARISGLVASVGLGLLIVLQMLPQTANVIPLFQIFGHWQLLDKTIGVIIADAALLIPFAVMLMRPFFRAVPVDIEEAASVDGATVFRSFSSVVLPLARNGIATTSIIVFMLSWGEFLYAVNLLLSPGTYPLSALVAQQVGAFGINWPGLMALAVLTSIPVLTAYVISYRLLRDGLTVGAVK